MDKADPMMHEPVGTHPVAPVVIPLIYAKSGVTHTLIHTFHAAFVCKGVSCQFSNPSIQAAWQDAATAAEPCHR